MKSINIPEVRLGIVAVSRDCFPIALSTRRRQNIVTACSVTARATSAPTSPRAKFCLWPPVLSAASASLPSPRWAASTAMC